jgi:hypothetical protein
MWRTANLLQLIAVLSRHRWIGLCGFCTGLLYQGFTAWLESDHFHRSSVLDRPHFNVAYSRPVFGLIGLVFLIWIVGSMTVKQQRHRILFLFLVCMFAGSILGSISALAIHLFQEALATL